MLVGWSLVLAVGVLVGAVGRADEKPALSGTWVKKEGELKIEFCDKYVLKLYPHGDNPVIIVVCAYSADKKGRVEAKITSLEGKEEAKEKAKQVIPVGLKFRFQYHVKDGNAKLENVDGEMVEALKAHLEGEYLQKP
jgi:hypothetical protein